MKSVGVDPAAAGFSAIALVENGEPIKSVVWKPSDTKISNPKRLEQFYNWLIFQFSILKPDIISIEELAVHINKTVVRQLARYEGVALLAAKKKCDIVLNPPITSSRAVVFEKGGKLKKEVAFNMFKKLYPEVKINSKSSSGMDQVDAYIHALAASTLLERR